MKIRTLAITAVLVVMLAAAALVMPAAARYGGGEVTEESDSTATAGNCLSFPVIWAEGVTKTLRGTPGMDEALDGVWYYWWGTDSDGLPLTCLPDPDRVLYCDNSIDGSFDTSLAPPDYAIMVYPQQDAYNTWQAGSFDGSANPVYVDLLDWGDNLESVDWYTKSKVRTEVVLFEDSTVNSSNDYGGVAENYLPMTQYLMSHISGWGIDELWGLSTNGDLPQSGGDGGIIMPERTPDVVPNTQATVYSHCARLTIQKLLVARDDLSLANLMWVPGTGVNSGGFWIETEGSPDLIGEPVFNKVVYETGDGPGYYSAEINVKGKVMYGYTWDVKEIHDNTPVPPSTKPSAAGDYRITFSLDPYCGSESIPLNTFFGNENCPVTEILGAAEEVVEMVTTESDDSGGDTDTGGAKGVMDYENNLTYIDVRILEKGGGNGPQPNQ